MGVGKFLRSLVSGDDRALAARDYAGQPSATETAAAARRRRHRQEVAELSAQNRMGAHRDIRGR